MKTLWWYMGRCVCERLLMPTSQFSVQTTEYLRFSDGCKPKTSPAQNILLTVVKSRCWASVNLTLLLIELQLSPWKKFLENQSLKCFALSEWLWPISTEMKTRTKVEVKRLLCSLKESRKYDFTMKTLLSNSTGSVSSSQMMIFVSVCWCLSVVCGIKSCVIFSVKCREQTGVAQETLQTSWRPSMHFHDRWTLFLNSHCKYTVSVFEWSDSLIKNLKNRFNA